MGLGGLCSSLTSMEILQRVFMEPEKVGKDRNFEVLTEDWKKRQFGGGGVRGVLRTARKTCLCRVTVGKGSG